MKLGDNLKNSIWNPFYEQGQPSYFKYSEKNACREWKISANWVEISFLSSLNILCRYAIGLTDLSEFREDITFCISYLLVGLRKKKFWFLSFRKSENVCVSIIDNYFFFSKWCKIIIKDWYFNLICQCM